MLDRGSWEAGRKSRVISAHTLREQHGFAGQGPHGLVHTGPLVSDRPGGCLTWSAGEGLASVGHEAVMGSQASTPVGERGDAQGTQAGSEGPGRKRHRAGGGRRHFLHLELLSPPPGVGLWLHQDAWVSLRM